MVGESSMRRYGGRALRVPVKTAVQTFPLKAANEALNQLRRGQIQGAAVLVVGESKT